VLIFFLHFRYESGEMHVRLRECAVPSKHLIFRKVGHGGFVVDWQPLGSGTGSKFAPSKSRDFDGFQNDLLSVLRGDPAVN
jgi:hypothetical protein